MSVSKQHNDVKGVRSTLSDPELIEAYEQLKYERDLNDREVITEALLRLLEEEGYLR